MKKKILAVFMAFVLVLTLTGCGGNQGNTSQEKMSNNNMTKMVTVHDGWVYGIGNVDEDPQQVAFVASKLDGSEKKIVSRQGIPSFVNVANDHLYYIFETPKGSRLFTCDLNGDNQVEVIKDKDVAWYQIVDDTLYFQELDYNFMMPMGIFKCDLDGKNSKEILSEEKEMYTPNVIGGKIYYQDAQKDDSVYAYDMESKKTKKITDKYTYMVTVDEEYAYGVQCKDSFALTGEDKGNVVKISLADGKSEVLAKDVYLGFLQVTEDLVYYQPYEDGGIECIGKDGKNKKTMISEKNAGNMFVYGDEFLYITYDEGGYFSEIYATNKKGDNPVEL